eukprot:403344488
MERSQQHLQNTASFQQSLAPKGNDYLINTRKRGRKRLSDQEFRVVDEKEADEIRKRNNQTLQEMMSGSQKQKKDSAKQPNNLPLTYYPQQQIVHQTAINYEAQLIESNKHTNKTLTIQQQHIETQQQYQYQQQSYLDQYKNQAEYVPVPLYTKERIDIAVKEYERLYLEYEQCGVTLKVKHYLQKIPDISKKLKLFDFDKTEMLQIIGEISKTLMMDEFEIVHWIKFVDRFEFRHDTFAMDIFFIALATKLLLNNQKTKEPFEVYLSKTNQQFFYFNYWITINNGRFYQDRQDTLITHRIFKKLDRDLLPKYVLLDKNQKPKRPADDEFEADFNDLVDQLMEEDQKINSQQEQPLSKKSSTDDQQLVKLENVQKQIIASKPSKDSNFESNNQELNNDSAFSIKNSKQSSKTYFTNEELKQKYDFSQFNLFNSNNMSKLHVLEEKNSQGDRKSQKNHYSNISQQNGKTFNDPYNQQGNGGQTLMDRSPMLMGLLDFQLKIAQTPGTGLDFMRDESIPLFPQHDLFGFQHNNHQSNLSKNMHTFERPIPQNQQQQQTVNQPSLSRGHSRMSNIGKGKKDSKSNKLQELPTANTTAQNKNNIAKPQDQHDSSESASKQHKYAMGMTMSFGTNNNSKNVEQNQESEDGDQQQKQLQQSSIGFGGMNLLQFGNMQLQNFFENEVDIDDFEKNLTT